VTLIAQAVLFMLGIALSIRMIAALYAILDLWYAIGAEYPRVLRGILGWGAVIAAISWSLSPSLRTAFLSGALAFLLYYLSLYLLRYPALRALQRRSRR